VRTAQILLLQLVRAQQFLRPQGGRDELDSHFKAVGCVENAAVFLFERRLQVLPSDVGVDFAQLLKYLAIYRRTLSNSIATG
jgi:hypothetical protein